VILVTCADGKTGQAILSALKGAGNTVRAMVHHARSAEQIAAIGVAETIWGDVEDRNDVERACEGIEAIYYIAPNMTPAERSIGRNMIAGAKANSISRFVFHSVLHTQLEALPHHWERHFVEQDIINSGLDFTILQVGSYMQNMLPAWKKMVATGVHRMAYDVDAPMSLVDLNDVAEVAVRVLTKNGYGNGIFEIVGPTITLSEKVQILSKVLGQTIRAEKEPLDEFLRHGKDLGFSEYTLEIMAKMFPYYDQHGLTGSDKVLSWLLGRSPTSFETFARRVASG